MNKRDKTVVKLFSEWLIKNHYPTHDTMFFKIKNGFITYNNYLYISFN